MLSEKPKSMLSETRKVTKSTMEKKRRARINSSLTELKNILAGMVANKGERFDKMEKADILELTVNCVKQLQKQSNTGDQVTSSTSKDPDYATGMHTCMGEVVKFLSTNTFNNIDPETKTKLLDHLANKLTNSSDTPSTHACTHVHSGFLVSQSGQTLIRHSPIDYSKQPLNCDFLSTSPSSTQSLFDDKDDDNNNNSVYSMPNSNIRISIADSSILNPIVHQVSPNMPTLLATSQGFQQSFQAPAAVSAANSVPTVPFILVPANLCSSTLGTSYVLPLTIPGQTTPLFQTSPNGNLPQQPSVNAGQTQETPTKPLVEILQSSPKTVHTLQNTNASSTPVTMDQQEPPSLPFTLSQTPLKVIPNSYSPVPTPTRPIILTSPVTKKYSPVRTMTYLEHVNSSSVNTEYTPKDACQTRTISPSTSGVKTSGFRPVQSTSDPRDALNPSNTFAVPKSEASLEEDTLVLAKRTVFDEETNNNVQQRINDIHEVQRNSYNEDCSCETKELKTNVVQRRFDRLRRLQRNVYAKECLAHDQDRHKTYHPQARPNESQVPYSVAHVQERTERVQESHSNIGVQERLESVQEPLRNIRVPEHISDVQEPQRNVNNEDQEGHGQSPNVVWRPW